MTTRGRSRYKYWNGPVVYPFGYVHCSTHSNSVLDLPVSMRVCDFHAYDASHCLYDGALLPGWCSHGISYTTFSLSWSPPPRAKIFRAPEDASAYTVEVKNTGSTYTADEVVLAFFKPKPATIPSLRGTGIPVVIKQLFGFERIKLAPGASQQLTFQLNATVRSTLSLLSSPWCRSVALTKRRADVRTCRCWRWWMGTATHRCTQATLTSCLVAVALVVTNLLLRSPSRVTRQPGSRVFESGGDRK